MSLLSTEEQLEQFVITEKYLRSILQDYPSLETPKVLIICGSGLGGISKLLKNDEQHPQVSIKYHDIPGFEPSHVPGHSGKLIFGHLGENSTSVMCMVGRFHYYEGHNFFTNTLPIRIAKLLGVKFLIVTNAAGGVNESYKPGDLMIINDHINLPGLAGENPLRGVNLDSFGPRFLPLSDAYDFDLRYELFKCAQKLAISRPIHEGTYFYVSGPTYESRAECRMLRILGADAVGMSTVPEVIIARHSGLKVIGISLITNSVLATKAESAKDAFFYNKSNDDIVDQVDGMPNHDEVLENANNAAEDVKKLVELFVSSL